MEPDDIDPRKKRRDPNDPFGAFDEFFAKMGLDPSEFDKMFRDIQSSLRDAMQSGAGFQPGKPFVTGFSFRMGPDGKPHIENFGNRPTRAAGGMPKISEEREPITDIVEDRNTIAVTMELPGVSKDDIRLEAKDDSLEISVDSERRKYHKIVRLPAKIKPKSTKATYKNGVLDVILERAEAGGGVSIRVE